MSKINILMPVTHLNICHQKGPNDNRNHVGDHPD